MQLRWILAAITATAVVVSGAEDGDEQRVRQSLVALIPFDVQLAITSEKDDVNTVTLSDIVADWMDDSFETKAANQLQDQGVEFDAIALDKLIVSRRHLRRNLQESSQARLYTASFTGVSLWKRIGDAEPISPDMVELIQRTTLLEDAKLLSALQEAPNESGLGSNVIDVRVFITPTNTNNNDSNNSDDSADNLELIIIIAIIVACLAFALLLFAVLWAWRSDHYRQEAFSASRSKREGNATNRKSATKKKQTSAGTGSESDDLHRSPGRISKDLDERSDIPPREISPSNYPESVISEDASAGLTAYYNQSIGLPSTSRRSPSSNHDGQINDAASMISMDSYGYSLDGYAPSLSGGPTQMGYPVGPINGQIKDPEALDDNQLRDLQDAVDNIIDGGDDFSSKPSI